ncbi:hypothetical protein [Sphingobacterium sp.]|uniref:hypothetical protein n=1 Tax=Sphingobacterium sp. TaxID=341027 RepID=UPI0028AE9AF9|nr:hypothetical protein [Sphingobacterium sp.]
MTDIEIIDLLLGTPEIRTAKSIMVTSVEIQAELIGPATKQAVNRLLEMDRDFYITIKGLLVIKRN